MSKAVLAVTLFCVATQPTLAALLNLAAQPLFIGSNIPPKILLTVSKDQQLFLKAYNDYSDLDGDGGIETTYKHSIDYYGYFDPTKCYTYSTTRNRFEPASISPTKYCTGQWSGNFLNWASMSRMDAVRKLLYGGARSTDQTYASGGANAETVLERSYLPTDAHAFAKYYNGADIALLTPFNPPVAAVPVMVTTSSKIKVKDAGDYDIPFSSSQASRISLGDQIRLEPFGKPQKFFIGAVLSFSGNTVRVRVTDQGNDTGNEDTWTLTNLSRAGISFCNLTPGSSSGSDSLSQTNTRAPLIRVAQGNFALWNANERWQCQWFEERNNFQSGFAGGLRSNGNQMSLSEFSASAENPSQSTHGLGTGVAQGEYVARIQVCKSNLIGDERCKLYPSGNRKPIGLLQEYGDPQQIHFGLMTGTYSRNIHGGVLRKNTGPLSDEVRVNSDGTFLQPSIPPGSPRTTSSTATPAGIINTLNYMRIYGYQYSSGDYLGASGDNCTYQQNDITVDTCTSWGNPMSEIYFESVRYFAGRDPTPNYVNAGSGKDNQLGLPIASWSDPVTSSLYCAPLNVVVFNPSVSTYDEDLAATSGTDINASGTIATLTNAVGDAEGITGNNYFVGKMLGAKATKSNDTGFELCTPKTITALGDVSGICPEGPTLSG
ncbi:MAG: hypothetical protein ACXWUU_06610 [Burkholderiales bacterium]